VISKYKHWHGFTRNSSTTTKLLECTHDHMIGQLATVAQNNIDVYYIELSKAFDSTVFSKFYLNYKTVVSLVNYLLGRSQCVVLEYCFSSVSGVISGVLQGSVLRPILFLIFINDVISICSGNNYKKTSDKTSK